MAIRNILKVMTLHLAQFNDLEQENHITWHALKNGVFWVAKSEVPFTEIFVVQTLEQEIKMLKRHGGMVY